MVELKLVDSKLANPGLVTSMMGQVSVSGCMIPLALLHFVYGTLKWFVGLIRPSSQVRHVLKTSADGLVIVKDISDKRISYKDILQITIHHRAVWRDPYNGREYEPRVVIKIGQDEMSLYLDSRHSQTDKSLKKFCEEIYQNGPAMRELLYDQRVFFGRTRNYSEIQKIKAKYNISW